ncbi:hypothetical protein HHK36_005612 [Tetracentron sinense]|uniref:THH1/TOM1/TOM3 domain-containing protein n=1 Tax=Tetracentron sinense TaxID=13715 RepID=A0A835DQU3_TETSI|nr:hypothetical protein HHK36_005612 [Tetracentron sinense]
MTRMPINLSSWNWNWDFNGMFPWWNKINESTRWQDVLFFALCAAYALVSSVALIQLIRIELRVPEYGWTTQKVFHLMNFIVNGARAVVFGFHKQVFSLKIKWIFLEPGTYLGVIGPSWTSVFLYIHASCLILGRDISSGKQEVFQRISSGLYIFRLIVECMLYRDMEESSSFSHPTLVCIWIYLWINDNSVVESIGNIFIAVVSFTAALSFLIYGGRLFFMLRRFPIESKGRRKKLHEVGYVTAICFTCFLIRCFVVMLSAFDSNASLDVLDHPLLNFIYYLLAEILPSALVLFILRKLPPKRISAQYHPIR